jgi:thiamine biosynthesis protein ThiS
MRVSIRTAGLVSRHLPPGSTGNKAQINLADGMTVAGVIAHLKLPDGRGYVTSVNGEMVPPPKWSEHVIKDGDQLAILPPMKGG